MYIILNQLLFKPFFAILAERKKLTEGSAKEADAMGAEVEQGRKDYEQRLKEAELKAQDEMAVIRKATMEEGKALIEHSRSEAEHELSNMRVEIKKNKSATKEELHKEAPQIGRSIAAKILDRAVPVAVLAVLLQVIPAVALASGGGGESTLLEKLNEYKLVNFAILVIAVVFAWKKIIKVSLGDRSAKIKTDLEEAATIKAAAEEKLKEYQEKLSQLDGKIQELRSQIKAESEKEKARLAEEARDMAVRLREQAKFTAEQEIKRAKDEIRKDMADVAIGLAKEIIAGEIKPDDQERITKSYLEKLRLN